MGVHSGRFGVVNGVSTVGSWQITDGGVLAPAVASNTAFGTARKPGIEEWSGSYKLFGTQPAAGQMPGDSISFIGYMAPDNDAYGAGQEYSGTAFIKQFTMNWNWAGGDILNMNIDFDGHLALVQTPATGPHLDATLPNFNQVPGTKFAFATDAAPTVFTDITDLVSATFTLTNSIQPYVNSSTFITDRVWTGRKAGIFDWTVSWTEQNVDRSRFKKGDNLALKLYVTASTFWLLKFGRVKDFTNIVVDRETGKIIQQTVNLEMSGVRDTDSSLGTITKPDSTVFWPVAQS